ncbi:Vacuolar_ATP synthase subunit H [Hexamita inflata]|uniref:Vacuolar_ATP synthase subunit H n=1 Tax=Hexamita inflata TaxID=28002 RepID=A0ABP1GV26_9EUKA
MEFLEYQLKARSYELRFSQLNNEVIKVLQQLDEPAVFAKQPQQTKDQLIQTIQTSLDFCRNKEFAQLMCIKLTEICVVDHRFDITLTSSECFPQIFDQLRLVLVKEEMSKLLLLQFLAITCRRLQMNQPKFDMILNLAQNLFSEILTAPPKDQVTTQTVMLQIVNRFLRNEQLIVGMFSTVTEQSVDKFYRNVLDLSSKPVEKIVKLFQNALQNFTPSILYNVLITCWLFSFQPKLQQMMLDQGIVSILLRAISQKNFQQNSKLIRASCLILNNLKTNAKAITQIVALNGQRLIQQLTTLSWPQDSQIEPTLHEVLKCTTTQIQETSTIQKYKTELEGTVLEMTPLHSNPAFFKANANLLTADQAVIMLKLIKIGEVALENDDRATFKVVLNDFGMFVQNHPQGREWVERLPGMLKVAMGGLKIEDEELQALAIQTVSKLLLNKVV